MKVNDRYSEAQAFVLTIQRQGIGHAAAVLQVAPSVVSRRLTALEKRLGTRLVERSTRQLRLTEAGAFYFDRMQQWLAELEDADARLEDWQQRVTGTLRIALPNVFGRLHVAPALPGLLKTHADLSLDLVFSDRVEDLLTGGFDLAIRIGELRDSRLVARKLADNHRVLLASPRYLATHGIPDHPDQLAEHNCLAVAVRDSMASWSFERGGEKIQVGVNGRIKANQGEALLEAALADCGITQLARFIADPALKSGQLVELLPDWKVPATGIYAVWPSAQFTAPKVRVFVDYFAERFARMAF